jgi:hypothetical protein
MNMKGTHMKTLTILLIACCFIGCTATEPVDITTETNIDPYVGQRVALRGTVTSETYVPCVGPIDAWELAEHRGQDVEQIGILCVTVVTEEEAERMSREMEQHRGAGRFYRLDEMTYRLLDDNAVETPPAGPMD